MKDALEREIQKQTALLARNDPELWEMLMELTCLCEDYLENKKGESL